MSVIIRYVEPSFIEAVKRVGGVCNYIESRQKDVMLCTLKKLLLKMFLKNYLSIVIECAKSLNRCKTREKMTF